MTLKECYENIGGDYDDVLGRFRREALVEKFVLKFPEDKSYTELCRAIDENNGENAFRAAHTIKGVCQNLGFTVLFSRACELTEDLRAFAITEKTLELFRQVSSLYEKTVSQINAYKAQAEV